MTERTGPEVPSGPSPYAWRWPIGLPYTGSEMARQDVSMPLVDDGPWGGVPLGGLGAGSIGRTHRGDFARWHLDVGRHRFETIPADQFSVYVSSGGDRSAHVLSTIRPETLPSWNWDLPEGAGTYHGLFPSAWFEYEWAELPVRLTQRQFSPVIPGNYRESSYPVGIFEWQIENPGPDPVTVGLMFSWLNDIGRDAGQDRGGGHRNVSLRRDGMAGVLLQGPSDAADASWNGGVAIMAREEPGVELTTFDRFLADDGSDLWADFAADGRLGDVLDSRPSQPGQAIGAAIAATVELAPGETKGVSFVLAWDMPVVEFGSGTRWYKRYTRFFDRSGGNAWAIGAEALACRSKWSTAIDAWQAPILADPSRPDWYKGALFNELYFLVDGGTVWTDGDPLHGPQPAENQAAQTGTTDSLGHFAVLECYDYPFYNTLDVNFYASWALLLLWPELDVGVVRDFAATVDLDDAEIVTVGSKGDVAPRKRRGAMPHDLGAPNEDPFLRPNAYHWRDINIWKDLNSKFVLQVWRDVELVPAPDLARDTWSAVVQAMDYLGGYDRDGDGLPEHDGQPDQTYDMWSMTGPSAYTGALWLAALRAAIRLGEMVGDAETVSRFRDLHDRGSASFEAKLWNGRSYRFDASDEASSDSVMADQLAGQWYADATGLGDLVSPERIVTALRTVYESNVLGFGGGEMGAVNGIRPDGSIDDSTEQSAESWTGTTYALAAFMIGRGLTDEGWRTAHGAFAVTYGRGLWFRTPEAYLQDGRFRAAMYLRPLAIWAIEHTLRSREE
ncbi:MAG TPA: non-lysosomal glucosylceramidase [Candidatus Dormibacteraeota bacterium]|nr:non-lysosomal glucosylceramidase [Candidatus Dormibacteraeota bacterium]